MEVFAQAADRGVKLVWLQGQSDSACTVSLVQGYYPDIYDAVMKLNVNIAYQPTIMVPFGSEAFSVLETVHPDVLVLEGSVPTGEMKYACAIGERNGKPVALYDLIQELAARTKVGFVAVGACATHGGIPAGRPNPTNAKGLKDVLPGRTVINIPGCPPQPAHMLLTLASVILGIMPELDSQGRPKAFYGKLLHDECPRRGYYNRGKFAKLFSDEECLYELGCRGPVTFADCASRKWNGGVNMCTTAGAPCIGCFEFGFPDKFDLPVGFYESQRTLELKATKNFFDALIIGTMATAAGYVGVELYGRRKRKKEEGGQ